MTTLAKSEKLCFTNVKTDLFNEFCLKFPFDLIKQCNVPLASNTETKNLQQCVCLDWVF